MVMGHPPTALRPLILIAVGYANQLATYIGSDGDDRVSIFRRHLHQALQEA